MEQQFPIMVSHTSHSIGGQLKPAMQSALHFKWQTEARICHPVEYMWEMMMTNLVRVVAQNPHRKSM